MLLRREPFKNSNSLFFFFFSFKGASSFRLGAQYELNFNSTSVRHPCTTVQAEHPQAAALCALLNGHSNELERQNKTLPGA